MKIVVNKCYGGFGLSRGAIIWLYENSIDILTKNTTDEYFGTKVNTSRMEKYNGYTFSYDVMVVKNHVYFYDDTSYDYKNNCPVQKRHNPVLVQCVETLGEKASGTHAKLKVIEIPDGVNYEIHEYDGMESIHEVHRSW